MPSKCLLIIAETDDVYFNLATEEYLLHNFDQDIVFLYINSDAVVLGKHQNAFNECRITKCRENGVAVARRLSGGGTVYHGDGNINFCFIRNGEATDKLIDFKKHLKPVQAFLHSKGLPSEYSGRNDLLLHEKKISGNAEHVYKRKNRVIHHGTLLFNADLGRLNESIALKKRVDFKTHAVQSVRSVVANIQDYLVQPETMDSFYEDLGQFLGDYFLATEYRLSAIDHRNINDLVQEKFGTWDWNFGYSPSFTVTLSHDNGNTSDLHVKKGLIKNISGFLESAPELIGMPYKPESFEGLASPEEIEEFF